MLTVLKDGKPLDRALYTYDEHSGVFTSAEHRLVIIYTGKACTFNTGAYCLFQTSGGCTFKTGFNCTFVTGADCKFYTSSHCVFNTGSACTFQTGIGCAIIRRDVTETITPPDSVAIRLNNYGIKGFTKI